VTVEADAIHEAYSAKIQAIWNELERAAEGAEDETYDQAKAKYIKAVSRARRVRDDGLTLLEQAE
jgi:hypothetical protein